ncbi:uncharacterized protein MONOS_3578 [Monocercomonoides exilis]|uniref:uncharacterized protein n=1 Tax=Monocercomonoides exilis TaxID=2049356 RepID=UPI00355949C0|nr:hypothetical protein MONOS_3578 [Monocercomonoides exilis]|eukprot:MONOS_3578.1-p1 / transcript=MONOS_3578.1 / gene=MONOS_3578 / organism=Monocercomonoides_exilis_PA203 / gene_product=unspecified product / transcript_product=unspecified product / location=Mono_scaffold00085:74045-77455(-) / protein_length=970 / sequence_SO=supercontig / SO=protein_coding / is_pseudo=false
MIRRARVMLFVCLITVLNLRAEIGTWTEYKIDVPAFHGHTAVIENGRIYIIGGKNGDTYNDKCYIINEKGEVIGNKKLENEMEQRFDHSFVNCVEGALLVGGTYKDKFLDDVWFFDYMDQTFIEKPKLPTSLSQHTCASTTDGDIVVIWGGKTKSEGSNEERDSYNLYVATKSNGYSFKEAHVTAKGKSYPPPLSCELTYWQKIDSKYIFILSGGYATESGNPTSLYKLYLEKEGSSFSGTFEPMYSQPDGLLSRRQHLAGIYGSSLFLFGGNSASSFIEKYNLIDFTYYRLSAPTGLNPPPLMDFACCCLQDSTALLVIGGRDCSDPAKEEISGKMYRFDLDPCYSSADCKTCVASTTCSWCSTKHTCVSMSQQTGKAVYETCTHLMHSELQCPSECEESRDCGVCLRHKGCGWCQNTYATPEPFAGCVPGNVLGPTLGSCGSWAYGSNVAELCKSVMPVFTLDKLTTTMKLTAAELYMAKWSFSQDVYGLADVYAAVKEKGSTTVKETLLQKGIYLDYPYARVAIPAGGEGATVTIRFYVYSPGSPNSYVMYESEEYLLESPKMKVISPTKDDTCYGTEKYKIQFERGDFDRGVSVALHHLQNLEHPVKTIIFWTEESEVEWDDMEGIPSANDYVIVISSTMTGVRFAISDVFKFRSDDIALQLVSPSPQTVIEAGESVLIDWKCNDRAGNMQVVLYTKNADDSRERVQIISPNQDPHTSLEWEAVVSRTADNYIICVEEIVTHTEVCSPEKTIKQPSLELRFKAARHKNWYVGEEAKLAENVIIVEGDDVTIAWDYVGRKAKKDIMLYSSSNTTPIGIARADEAASSYVWSVPEGLGMSEADKKNQKSLAPSQSPANASGVVSSSSLYSFISSLSRSSKTLGKHIPGVSAVYVGDSESYHIEVNSMWRNVTARSLPFVVARPGQVPVRSIGSVIAIAVVAFVLAIGLLVLWKIYFRKNMVGFTPLG